MSSDDLTGLYARVKKGDALAVRRHLARGVDVNARDRYGSTLLHMAASCGNSALIRELLARGAEIDAPNRHGQTALVFAATSGSVPAVRVLLDHGARTRWRSGAPLARELRHYGGVTPKILALIGAVDAARVERGGHS